MIFLFSIPFIIAIIPLFILIIGRIIELKARSIKAPLILIIGLALTFFFFLMMVSLNKGVSAFDLLRNPREYFFNYSGYLVSLALGILPMITIFLYGDKDFFLTFSKEKLLLIPLLLFCAFPPSLIGAGLYYGTLDVIPILNGHFLEAFSPLSDYPLGIYFFGALLIGYCFSIFLFVSFYLSTKYKLLNCLVVILIFSGSFYITESKTLTGEEMEKLFNEAKMTGNIEICEKIKGEPIDVRLKQYECITEIAVMRQDENLCEKLPYFYGEKRVGAYYDCYEKIAKIKSEPSLCKHDFCYYDLGILLKKPEVCDKIDSTWYWHECFLKINAFRNPKICEIVKDEKRKNYCLVRLALFGTITDPEILKEINWEGISCSWDFIDLYRGDKERCSYYKELYK